MAKSSKSTNKMIGLVLLVAGIGLVVWGYQMSGSIGSQLNQAFSGSPANKVMAMYIGGAVCAVAGMFLLKK